MHGYSCAFFGVFDVVRVYPMVWWFGVWCFTICLCMQIRIE